MAATTLSSVGRGAVSPSGVQAVWLALSSFTGRLLAPVQRRDQRMPRERASFHARGIFVHARQRLQPFQRFFQRTVTYGASAGAGKFAERLEQRLGVRPAAAFDGLRPQVGG